MISTTEGLGLEITDQGVVWDYLSIKIEECMQERKIGGSTIEFVAC